MDELLTIAGYIAATATVVAFIGIPIARYRSKKKARDELLARRLADTVKVTGVSVKKEAPKRKPNRGG